MTTRQVVTAASARFLPSVASLMAVLLVIEPLVRRREVFGSLRSVYVPLVIAEPLLIAMGFALCLWLIRNGLGIEAGRKLWRHLVAAFIALVTLGITSIFTQGADLPFIALVSILSGGFAAVTTFGIHSWRAGVGIESAA
jgi:hypothetical protein